MNTLKFAHNKKNLIKKSQKQVYLDIQLVEMQDLSHSKGNLTKKSQKQVYLDMRLVEMQKLL